MELNNHQMRTKVKGALEKAFDKKSASSSKDTNDMLSMIDGGTMIQRDAPVLQASRGLGLGGRRDAPILGDSLGLDLFCGMAAQQG